MKELNRAVPCSENLDVVIEEMMEREEFSCTGNGCAGNACGANHVEL